MALKPPVRLRVEDPSGVAPCRRAAERLADAFGFDDVARGEAAIVVTELATNLIRHAGGGEIVLRGRGGDPPQIDAIAWDRGPGLGDVARSLRDGFSTAGGSGTGLGAIGRLSTTFDLQSTPGRGAVLVARLGAKASPAVDGLALPLAGEDASGDAWAHVIEDSVATVVLADGLGHGDDAAHASGTALRELRAGLSPEELLERMHGALRSTRGAAAAIAQVHLETGAVRFAGIGNISAVAVRGTTTKALASQNGTLGHRVQRIQAYDHQLEAGGLLVLHSDGVRTGWDLMEHPGLLRRDPLVVASLLLRDFERGRDDMSAVVLRVGATPPGLTGS